MWPSDLPHLHVGHQDLRDRVGSSGLPIPSRPTPTLSHCGELAREKGRGREKILGGRDSLLQKLMVREKGLRTRIEMKFWVKMRGSLLVDNTNQQ